MINGLPTWRYSCYNLLHGAQCSSRSKQHAYATSLRSLCSHLRPGLPRGVHGFKLKWCVHLPYCLLRATCLHLTTIFGSWKQMLRSTTAGTFTSWGRIKAFFFNRLFSDTTCNAMVLWECCKQLKGWPGDRWWHVSQLGPLGVMF
jgi:hypothetical protein